MTDQAQVSLAQQGAKVWNDWKADRPIAADLETADLAGRDLSGADLRGANLKGASLRKTKLGPGTLLWNANLTKADLYQADLSGADLQDAVFTRADLFEATLREANLQGADLSSADGGLRTEQLAGANLTGASLPEPLKRLYDDLENVKGISESARKLFLAVLAACLYSWLTIATTTDVNLVTNRNASPLPIIQTSIPIVGFYVVAPVLVLCVYFYFHFYLQKLWEELGSLPAVLPDGRPLHAKVDPWLLNDLVRAHLPKLSVNRPFLSYLQLWISVLLAWWVVPVTMFLFWGRYLSRHEGIGTTLHVILLAISILAAVRLYRLAVATLRGAERKPFAWRNLGKGRGAHKTFAFAATVGLLFGLTSLGAIQGVRSSKAPIPYVPGFMPLWEQTFFPYTGPRTWVPRWMAFIGYSPFANLMGAEVSQRKSTGGKEGDKNTSSGAGAQLGGVNLRFALAIRAFLAGAQLAEADLSGAHLIESDLSDADMEEANLGGARLGESDLHGAHLAGADLTAANLRDANLSGSDLSGATLRLVFLQGAKLQMADLNHTDLRSAILPDSAEVKKARNWDSALYDPEMLIALGLPPDNNQKVASRPFLLQGRKWAREQAGR